MTAALPSAAPAARRSRVRNLVCMTLYNEDAGMVRAGLAALVESLAFADREAPSEGLRSIVAIVADGADRVDPAVLALFRGMGLVDGGTGFKACGETVHVSRMPAAAILAALGADGNRTGTAEIGFAVCIKARNRGKLHSHEVFFRGICPVLAPEFCYQIDAGTIVAPDAIAEMVAFMAANPDAAAAASHVLTPPPTADAPPLAVWQFMDFVAQKAVTWPTEVASGYLSIIPGQFCVFRWSAIDRSRSPETGRRTVDSYLRGLDGGSPLERVMFLAEDRVFGNEIVLAEEKAWSIGYCEGAEATTDPCESFGELLRQRRRWQNSALAVRLWLWQRWPAYLRRHDKSVADKLRFSRAMAWQGLLTACELLSPAFLAVLLVAAVSGAATAPESAIAAVATVAFATTAVLTFLSCRRSGRRFGTAVAAARDASAALSVALLVGATAYLLPPAAAAILLGPPLVTAAAIAAAFRGRHWQVLRYFPVYLLIDRVLAPIITCYALARIDDVSWGTKGLVGEAAAMRSDRARLRHFRNVLAGTILFANVTLLVVGLSYDGIIAVSTSIVVELFSLLALIVAVTAMATHLRHAVHHRPSTPVPPAPAAPLRFRPT